MLNEDIEKFERSPGYLGLRARKRIPSGDVIHARNPEDPILTLEEVLELPLEIRMPAYRYKDGFIIETDGSDLMNHSCSPNTWWNDDDTLIALKDIEAGTEITYDYVTSQAGINYRSSWICRCQSPDCRRVLKEEDLLLPEIQQSYGEHLPSWAKTYIKEQNKSGLGLKLRLLPLHRFLLYLRIRFYKPVRRFLKGLKEQSKDHTTPE